MTVYRKWDIVLVRFPFTNLTTAKKRPVLVVSPDTYNLVRDRFEFWRLQPTGQS